jgi:hypothetical protein
MDIFDLGPDDPPSGRIQQRGMGGHTLCGKCNSDTGGWYGSAFANWCYQGLDILIRADGKPSLIYPHYVLPLRVIKQVATMFFTVCGPEFRDHNDDLVGFVLNPERRYLPDNYGFYVYYNLEGTYRFASPVAILNMNRGNHVSFFSEITFPPFGYVMTLDSEPPDSRLFPIRHFARYGYNEFESFEMRLPVLPTFLSIPGDYRTRSEIEIDRIKNELLGRSAA